MTPKQAIEKARNEGVALAQQDEKIAALTAELAAAREALLAIVRRGDSWLANDHDYGTAYKDRPEGDRVANAMLAAARAALKQEEA